MAQLRIGSRPQIPAQRTHCDDRLGAVVTFSALRTAVTWFFTVGSARSRTRQIALLLLPCTRSIMHGAPAPRVHSHRLAVSRRKRGVRAGYFSPGTKVPHRRV